MLRFRLFGFPITVQPWHWLILALLSGQLMHLSDRATLGRIVMFVAAGFVSILIHELGHAFASRHFGCRRVEIVLHGMGGVAISHDRRTTRKQDILISLAGPFIQLFAGGLVFLLWWIIPDIPIRKLFGMFVFVSLFWALINLLPVHPLDGGQVLFSSLGPGRRTLALRISMISAIVAAVVMFAVWRDFLFPILLGFMAWQNYQMLAQPQQPRGW